MRLFSYVVARDYGFAPNPFFGTCTLATCKPMIRRAAQVGDWIVGTGSQYYQVSGHLVFYMKVSETLTFDEYWNDKRFKRKRPKLRGSLKQAFGDNIYHTSLDGDQWLQEDSHHSYASGQPNEANILHDTQVPKVLVALEFAYWGGLGPVIPEEYREKVCARRGHKSRFDTRFVRDFVNWLGTIEPKGYVAPPREFGLPAIVPILPELSL